MIKRAFIAALGFVAASTAFAQESVQSADATESVEYSTDKYKVETNSFWDNWFISIGAGGQVYFGDTDFRREPFAHCNVECRRAHLSGTRHCSGQMVLSGNRCTTDV